MTDSIQFSVTAAESGKRADVLVAARLDHVSRSVVNKLITGGHVVRNGAKLRPASRVSQGDTIDVSLALPHMISAAPERIHLSIVYQDSDVVVVDKPAGLVVHPAPGHASGTLANALTALFPQTIDVGTAYRPGIVHRLDKDTSGLLVVALNGAALASLQAQIASRTAGRRYLALASGRLLPPTGQIDAPIGRHPSDRKRMAAHGVASRFARTSYRVLQHIGPYTYLEAILQTGRTHQIRVHLAASGHPLVGDLTYGGPRFDGLSRQFLHAHQLSFVSPSTGDTLSFRSALPADLGAVLERIAE